MEDHFSTSEERVPCTATGKNSDLGEALGFIRSEVQRPWDADTLTVRSQRASKRSGCILVIGVVWKIRFGFRPLEFLHHDSDVLHRDPSDFPTGPQWLRCSETQASQLRLGIGSGAPGPGEDRVPWLHA